MNAKLVVASGKSAGRAISLKNGRILIGRAEECDVRPLGEEVSRRHCLILVEGDAVTVEDLKSRNGTFVNGERIAAKTTAKNGDIVRVGPLELKVSLPAPAAASADPAPVAMDDVSRWLMADDEPAGMFDTTQTVRLPDPPAVAEPAASPSADGSSIARPKAESAEAGAASPAGTDSDSTVAASGGSAIEALLATRAQPGVLPAAARNASKSNNSKDAAADALRKFFGKR
ncbi:MAG: hypothetical protein RLZZ111_1931 [Planctomycetota bacterium]|jgi:hypothetical protein